MHNLALALHNKGYQVPGSDDAIFEPSKSRLEKKGLLPVEMGWFPEKITQDIEAIILGMHAKADNPELARPSAARVPCTPVNEICEVEAELKPTCNVNVPPPESSVTPLN